MSKLQEQLDRLALKPSTSTHNANPSLLFNKKAKEIDLVTIYNLAIAGLDGTVQI